MCARNLPALLSQWLNERGGSLELPEGSDADAVGRILATAGFDLRVACLADLADKRELLEHLHSVMHFDDWFGFNWDALEEALHGSEDPEAPKQVLLLTGLREFSERAPADAKLLLEILDSVTCAPGSTLRGTLLMS